MTRPMTSRQAHRAYLNSKRGPRLSKAEERRMEREEQERIRNELKQQQAQARAQAARERKRAKEEEARREKKRRGEPICPVTASQGMISGFLKKSCGGVSKGSDGGVVDENARNGAGAGSKMPPVGWVGHDNAGNVAKAIPKGSGGRVGDKGDRNSGSPVADIARHSPLACLASYTGKPSSPRPRGERKKADGKHMDNLSLSAPEQPNNTPRSEETRDSKQEGYAGPGRAAQDDGKDLDGLIFSPPRKRLDARAGDGNKSNSNPEGDTDRRQAGQEECKDLDDLFLSASQLAREVEGVPPPTRKRSRDEVFPPPEPPAKHPDRMKESPKLDAADDLYDLGLSSQELLQLEAVEEPALQRPSTRPPMAQVEETKPEPSAPDISFSDSFSFCSQELRDIDALIAEVPRKTKHPISTNANSNPSPIEQHTKGKTSDGHILEELDETPLLTTHVNTSTNPNTNGRDTAEAPQEDTDHDPDEPQRFFTSGTQELISLAEMRSHATAEAEARRRRNASKPLSNPKDGARGGAGNGGKKPEGTMSAQAGKAAPRMEKTKTRESNDTGHALHKRSGNGTELRRSSSLNLDDEEWWEDLDNTDLEALLAVA